VDFASSDVNMKEFIETLPKHDNLKFSIHTLHEQFNKGRGLNYGTNLVTNDIVFFLDADMMIQSRELFEDIETYVVKQNKVLFPICWSYSDPEHTTGWKRDTGTGNVIQHKSTIVPYVNNTKWGMEDTINFRYFDAQKLAVRTYYKDKFVHQWHPEYISHIHYEGAKSSEQQTSNPATCARADCPFLAHSSLHTLFDHHCCGMCKLGIGHGPKCEQRLPSTKCVREGCT
jgi:glycosyltransferase involved in cell wall biosynthesis